MVSAAAWAKAALQNTRCVIESQPLTVVGYGVAALLLCRILPQLFEIVALHVSPALQRKRLPPGRWGFLWIEETVRFVVALGRGQLLRFRKERTDKYASCTFRTSVFLQPTVIFQGAAANSFLAGCERRQEAVNHWPAFVLELMGKNVPVNVQGAQHRRQKQIMSKCLGSAGLQRVVSQADQITQRHIRAAWIEAATAPATAGGGPLLIVDAVKNHLMRLSFRLLAAVEDEEMLNQMQSQFKIWTAGFNTLPLYLPGTAYYKAMRARDALWHSIDGIIGARRQKLASAAPGVGRASSSEGDLLSQFLLARDDEGAALSDEELRDLILFLLFAAFETSTSTLSSALKFLEQHPSSRNRLLQEHQTIVSEKKNQSLDWTDIMKMEYTWAFLQETLRLKNPIVGSMKEVHKEISYDGYSIPKGWKIFFDFSSTHTSEDCFKDPARFNPSRFELKALEKERHPPFSFVPFGIGPHSCKGVEFARMTLCLYIHHLIINNLKWTSVDPNESTIFPVVMPSKGYPAFVSVDKWA